MEFNDWGAAVDAYVQEDPYDCVTKAKVELADALASPMDDRELARTLMFCGTGYDPRLDGYATYREWLIEVAKRMDEALRAKSDRPDAN